MLISLIAGLAGLVAFASSSAASALHEDLHLAGISHNASHRFSVRAKTPSVTCKNGFHYTTDRTACVCPTSKYISLDGNKCLSFCSSGSFIQKGTQECQACPNEESWLRCSSATVATGCKDGFFLHAGDCVERCPTGTWEDSSPGKNRCRACACSDALSCKDSQKGSATACGTKYLYKGECLDEVDLPNGFWADDETHTALACDPFVAACTGNGRGHALSCGKNKKNDQYFLTPYKDCRLHCPYGWYGVKADGMCYPCDKTMETCDAGGAILCAKSESEATGRLIKTPDRRCIPSGSSIEGYYLNNETGTYEPCADGVTSCTGVGEESALSCGIASNGTQLYMHTERMLGMARMREKRKVGAGKTRPSPIVSYNGLHIYNDCVDGPTCERGTFPNATSALCQQCNNMYAATCDDEGKDLTCLDEFYSIRNETGLFCVPDTKCKTLGPYYPGDNYQCLPCADGVIECTGPSYQEARACGIASNGTQLIYSQGETSCGLSCPAGTWLDNEWHDNPGYFLNDGACVNWGECPEATFEDYDNNTCTTCSSRYPNSSTCTYDTIEACLPDSLLLEGDTPQCVAECPSTHYEEEGQCKRCSDVLPFAEKCSSKTEIINCQWSYSLDKQTGTCVKSCNQWPYVDANGVFHLPSYKVFSTCEPCADALAFACSSASYITGCWQPAPDSPLTAALDGACVSLETCTAKSPAHYFGRTRAQDSRFDDVWRNYYTCKVCPTGYTRTEDGTGCLPTVTSTIAP
ncbi:hypothetical protein JCM6882_002735 [Rhodosporidiobolus microsporus]